MTNYYYQLTISDYKDWLNVYLCFYLSTYCARVCVCILYIYIYKIFEKEIEVKIDKLNSLYIAINYDKKIHCQIIIWYIIILIKNDKSIILIALILMLKDIPYKVKLKWEYITSVITSRLYSILILYSKQT